jgi:hypothetical protein
MDRRKANIILRVFIGIWIFLGLTVVIFYACSCSCLQSSMKYLIQLIIALFCSVWLGVYIWKNSN